MRRIRYQVAASLDGYIAGPQGEYDWIVMDPEIEFGAIFKQFDTLLMGRVTFEQMQSSGDTTMFGNMKTVVFSRTLSCESCPDVDIVGEDWQDTIRAIREEPGKDIWLFGGGKLFQSLLAAGFVDRVEIAVIPILLGGGIPMLPSPATTTQLTLARHQVYKTTGTVLLEYDVRST